MSFTCAFERGGPLSRSGAFNAMKKSHRAITQGGTIVALYNDGRKTHLACSETNCPKITKDNSFFFCSLMEEGAIR
jgi:hypothetical protein